MLMNMNMLSQEIPEIDLSGFQVVKSDMFQAFTSRSAITMTVWPDSISFSQASINALKKCEHVRIEINYDAKCILVIPVTTQDRNNVRWAVSDKGKTRRIGCLRFVSVLYSAWNWNTDMAYKGTGRLVASNEKVMILYSFEKASNWKHKKNS